MYYDYYSTAVTLYVQLVWIFKYKYYLNIIKT